MLALLVPRWAWRPRVVEPPPTPDLDGVAFLAGGEMRLVELSIARLIEGGTLRVNRKGRLAATTERVPDDPLEAEVFRTLNRPLLDPGNLLYAVDAGEHARRVASTLSAQRLLITPSTAAKIKRRSVLGLYLLLVTGFARLVNGLVADLPVGYLALPLGVTIVVIIVLHGRWRPQPLTVLGGQALDQARHSVTSGVGLVALGGLSAYPDEDIRAALTRSMPLPVAWSARSAGGAGASGGGVGAGAVGGCAYTACGGPSYGGGGGGCGGGGGGCGGSS